MKKNYILKILFVLFLFNTINAQVIEEDKTWFNRKTLTVAGVAGIHAFTLVESYITWWKGDGRKFNFYTPPSSVGWFNDPASRGIDKVGHFYTSYFFYRMQKNVLLWGGHSESFSTWFSASLSAGMAVIIEVGDAFSSYGFDYQDLTFNIGGLAYGVLQDEYPFFKNFQFKWSYIPDDGLTFPPKFTEHYPAHIYWLAVDVGNLSDHKFSSYWPSFINPAIGFSISNDYEREFFVGLDLNLLSLLGGEDEDVNLLIEALDLFHLPVPGIKYSEAMKPEYKLFILR